MCKLEYNLSSWNPINGFTVGSWHEQYYSLNPNNNDLNVKDLLNQGFSLQKSGFCGFYNWRKLIQAV